MKMRIEYQVYFNKLINIHIIIILYINIINIITCDHFKYQYHRSYSIINDHTTTNNKIIKLQFKSPKI